MKNIKIKIDEISLLILLFATLCGYIKNALYICSIIIIHELGHILIALLFKYKIVAIVFYPFGGITKINKKLNGSIYQDLLMAFGGILMQLILLLIIKDPLFTRYNIAILIFNLLPIIPLDGSKILLEIINIFVPYKKSILFYCYISSVFIVLYLVINYQFNLNNYLITFLFISKTIEALKYKNILFEKFILERGLYDLKYQKIGLINTKIKNYKKDEKYYYQLNNNLIDQKEYINLYFKQKD